MAGGEVQGLVRDDEQGEILHSLMLVKGNLILEEFQRTRL